MQKVEFRQTVNELVLSSFSSLSVLMCSENNFAECHRSLLADYLSIVHHIHIVHILFNGEICDHAVNPQARFNDKNNTCIYPSVFLI